jgi:chemotaxis protein CheD
MPEMEWVVGIAETKTAMSPDRLLAIGLGSCVAVTVHDCQKKIGGLAHIMLPSSRFHAKANVKGKYADTAIKAMVEELALKGGEKDRFEAKLVGGANMFSTIIQNPLPIGTRNLMAVREILVEMKIPITGEDVGGTQGRSLVFNLSDGKILVRKINQSDIWI